MAQPPAFRTNLFTRNQIQGNSVESTSDSPHTAENNIKQLLHTESRITEHNLAPDLSHTETLDLRNTQATKAVAYTSKATGLSLKETVITKRQQPEKTLEKKRV